MHAKPILLLAALAAFGAAPVKPDFGLKKGNVWTYTVRSGSEAWTLKETALDFVKVGDAYALEIKSESEPGGESYRYLGQDERGLLGYYNLHMSGPGVSSEMAPVILAQLPFNKGLAWKWVERWRGQTFGEVDPAELRKLDQDMSAVIVADREPVVVPAGSYEAVHVRVTSESVAGGKRFEDHWYVFRVGLVKSVYAGRDGQREQLLTKFQPGA